jgi:hypothetical protein
MRSFDRLAAGFASRTRALAHLTLRRGAYKRALSTLPRPQGPTLVVGSAPNPTRPAGLDDSWFRISVNASQLVSDDFGLPPPNLTVFRDGIGVMGLHSEKVWKSLKGRSGEHVLAIMGSNEDHGLVQPMMREHDYEAGGVTELSRHVRGAVVLEMTGRDLVSLSSHMGVSNGLFAALLAVKLGGNPVVMSGFSFQGGWYFAPEFASKREHVSGDSIACQAIVERNLPVYTSDPKFSEDSGIRLWTGTMA